MLETLQLVHGGGGGGGKKGPDVRSNRQRKAGAGEMAVSSVSYKVRV